MRNYNGGIKIINKTGAEAISIDLNSGQIVLSSTTVTNGTIVVRGVGKLIDESGDRIRSGNFNGATIVNELIDSASLQELWQLAGLDIDNPLSITDSLRQVASVQQTISDNGTTTTVTRQ
jgi:hypothetical protein